MLFCQLVSQGYIPISISIERGIIKGFNIMGSPESLLNKDFLPCLVPSPSEGELTDEMVPSLALARRLIYLNCFTEDLMKRQIEDYISQKFTEFGLESYLAQNLIDVLQLVDESYHYSFRSTRRTGERFGSHPYRVTAEWIHWVDQALENGLIEKKFFQGKMRPFYLGGFLASLHDAGEDLGGKFDIERRMMSFGVEKSFSLNLDSLGLFKEEMVILQLGVEALTKPPKEPEVFDPEIRARQKAAKLFSSAFSLMEEYGWYYYLLPIVVKRGDMRDNLRTEFVFDKRERRYRLPEDKAWFEGKLREKLYLCQSIAVINEGALGEKITASEQEIISSLLKGRSFETIFGRCFRGRKEGKLAFFDPFGESQFKFAFQEVASLLSLAA